MTAIQLRDRIIADGLASVERDERMRPEQKQGSREGFEACRSLVTHDEYETLLRRLNQEATELIGGNVVDYWKVRYRYIQVEFVYETMLVAWGLYPQSARAVIRFAAITGNAAPLLD